MNQIETARTAIASLCDAGQRLASVTVTESTKMCADPAANEEFTRLTGEAESALEAAIGVAQGTTRTKFQSALDQVRRSRQAFFVPSDENRNTAWGHALRARELFTAGEMAC